MPVLTHPRKKQHEKLRKAYARSSNSELSRLQEMIVSFLGEIDSDLCLSVFQSQEHVCWEATELLKFDIPFVDMKVRIYLGKVFTRPGTAVILEKRI